MAWAPHDPRKASDRWPRCLSIWNDGTGLHERVHGYDRERYWRAGVLGHAGPYPPSGRGCRDPSRLYGGDVANATYRNHGTHAETIEITYDPARTSFRPDLEFIFQIHDPTTPNRQGNDRGLSYRSAIFYVDDEQRRVAEETIADVEASGPLAGAGGHRAGTRRTVLGGRAGDQDYLERHPTAIPATSSDRIGGYGPVRGSIDESSCGIV